MLSFRATKNCVTTSPRKLTDPRPPRPSPALTVGAAWEASPVSTALVDIFRGRWVRSVGAVRGWVLSERHPQSQFNQFVGRLSHAVPRYGQLGKRWQTRPYAVNADFRSGTRNGQDDWLVPMARSLPRCNLPIMGRMSPLADRATWAAGLCSLSAIRPRRLLDVPMAAWDTLVCGQGPPQLPGFLEHVKWVPRVERSEPLER